jgi:hypothetical protein
MKHEARQIHFVGGDGTAASREQGPRSRGCDRPRVASADDGRRGVIGVRHEA